MKRVRHARPRLAGPVTTALVATTALLATSACSGRTGGALPTTRSGLAGCGVPFAQSTTSAAALAMPTYVRCAEVTGPVFPDPPANRTWHVGRATVSELEAWAGRVTAVDYDDDPAGRAVAVTNNLAQVLDPLRLDRPEGLDGSRTMTVTWSAADARGNVSSVSADVTLVGSVAKVQDIFAPKAGATYVLHEKVVADYVCGPDPALVASCTGTVPSGDPVDTSTVGRQLLLVVATDKTGAWSSGHASYDVRYATRTCNGGPGHTALGPVKPDGTAEFRAGSPVPIKFRVCDADGVSVSKPGIVTGFGPWVEPPAPMPADFHWNPGPKQWEMSLSTEDLPGGAAYAYVISLDDGSSILARFILR